jgi:uridylate kinase
MKEYVALLKKLKADGHEIVTVVGGGVVAREFIEIAKALGIKEKSQDEVAILVSRLLAELFARALNNLSCENIPKTVEEAAICLGKGKIAVMGGISPGMTTDTVAALVAERINADLVIKASDQEGIYDKDPRKFSDAKKFEHLSFEELYSILEEKKHRVGIHQIIDPKAVKILQKTRIKTIVINGFKPENILLVLKGNKIGTILE